MPSVSLQIQRIDSRQADAAAIMADLRARLSPRGGVVSEASRLRTIEVFGEPLTPSQVVEKICLEVRERGLPAVVEYCGKLDRAEGPIALRVPSADLATAHEAASPQFLAAVRQVRANVEEFQRTLLPSNAILKREDGSMYLEHRYRPLERVGLCIPGGAAAYPSTLLMTAVPAQVAGVRQIVVMAPPTKFGAYNTDLLAACHELGISEVYRVGGAQGVAALAYGVEGIPRVDKIVGPGNLFVALAKRFVYGEVDIDSIAGPSEVVIVADESARPDFIAADMLAQAEHSPGASILITWCESIADTTTRALEGQLARLERGELARQSLDSFGAIVVVRTAEEACEWASFIAPEHLHLATDRPEEWVNRIPTAGAVFLGNFSPVACGDYAAGPSHVLPTGGTARFASGLSARDFLRSFSLIQLTAAGLRHMAPEIRALAEVEGLTAHRASVDIRLAAR